MRALLRDSATGGVVLLKNSAGVLPLTPRRGMKIAVIGPNAKASAYSGGGSASLLPTYTVTPYQAISAEAEKVGANVEYAMGADNSRFTPLLTPFISLPDGVTGHGIVCAEFYDQK